VYDKPWMRPIQYNDDTLGMTAPSAADVVLDADAGNEEEGIVKPVPDDLPREGSKPRNVSHDTTPMRRKGDRDAVIDLDDDDHEECSFTSFLTNKG
jgi:hypothetical protein